MTCAMHMSNPICENLCSQKCEVIDGIPVIYRKESGKPAPKRRKSHNRLGKGQSAYTAHYVSNDTVQFQDCAKKKVCSRCKVPKHVSHFYTNRCRKDGLSLFCKPCSRTAALNSKERIKQKEIV